MRKKSVGKHVFCPILKRFKNKKNSKRLTNVNSTRVHVVYAVSHLNVYRIHFNVIEIQNYVEKYPFVEVLHPRLRCLWGITTEKSRKACNSMQCFMHCKNMCLHRMNEVYTILGVLFGQHFCCCIFSAHIFTTSTSGP